MKSVIFLIVFTVVNTLTAQQIGGFTSISPNAQSMQFVLPSTHSFQKIIEEGDALTVGGTLLGYPDFTAYVPIANSSTNGYLSINHETAPGGVTILDINFNNANKLWQTTASQPIDFNPVLATVANCSGTVTPWGTVISSEEYTYNSDYNFDGYYDAGWNIEINPATKTIVNNQKLWAMGNFAHENVSIHSNHRTVYQGADSDPGYLYKFVATNPQDLSSGLLYVYSGLKNGLGNWILINNTTKTDRNNTLTLSANAGATVFAGIEDVEIGPDGYVYVAVKSEGQVYRFLDSNPLTAGSVVMETFVGNMSYNIFDGTITNSVPWGNGNDNLAFDGAGNLWVLQDGGNNYIWVVGADHTQTNPKVKLFGIAPLGSEPTGITFTPDFKYLFMSFMHPDTGNLANQVDAAGSNISFSKGTSLVIALKENLGTGLSIAKHKINGLLMHPNPTSGTNQVTIEGASIDRITLFSSLGKLILNERYQGLESVNISIKNLPPGLYFVQVNSGYTLKLIIK